MRVKSGCDNKIFSTETRHKSNGIAWHYPVSGKWIDLFDRKLFWGLVSVIKQKVSSKKGKKSFQGEERTHWEMTKWKTFIPLWMDVPKRATSSFQLHNWICITCLQEPRVQQTALLLTMLTFKGFFWARAKCKVVLQTNSSIFWWHHFSKKATQQKAFSIESRVSLWLNFNGVMTSFFFSR